MKAYFIHVGQTYLAKVAGKIRRVTVLQKREVFTSRGGTRTVYDCLNNETGRPVRGCSCQRFREPAPALATNKESQ